MKKKVLSTIALLLVLSMLIGCANTATTPAEPGAAEPASAAAPAAGEASAPAAQEEKKDVKDTVTIAIWSNPQTFDPTDVTLQPEQHIINAVFDTLVWPPDADGNYAPRLCTSYEYQDDTTMIFKLRDDVVFHNGEKLTADDVVYSLQRCCVTNGNKSSFAGFDPERIVAIDEYTVQVGFPYPNAAALAYLASPRGGIVSKKAHEELGEEAFKTSPVGSGMFQFVSFESGDRVVLARNENYWGDKPAYENLIFRVITEASVRAMEVQSGGVDIAMKISASDFDNLKLDPNLNCIAQEGVTQSAFQFNALQPDFADIRIRKAMTYALDMPAIVKAVYGDYAVAASSSFGSNVQYYVQLGPIVQDKELAKSLIAEAGYPNGFNTEITLPQESDMLAIAEICQAQWAECGINVEINIMEQVALREANTKGLNKFVRSSFFCSTGDPSQAMMTWGSNWNGGLRVRDEKVDELLEQGLSAYDSAERAKVYEELQQYTWDMFQQIVLACPLDLCVTSNKLVDFVLPTGYFTNYNSFYASK